MKKILNKIADFFTHQSIIVQVFLFALGATPFFFVGFGLYKWMETANWDMMALGTTVAYSLPALALFAGFIFALSWAHTTDVKKKEDK
jgi:hypothetical protein